MQPGLVTVSPGGEQEMSPPGTHPKMEPDKVCSTSQESFEGTGQDSSLEGLLDTRMFVEGVEGHGTDPVIEVQEKQDPGEGHGNLEDDAQPDTFAEGSGSFRGAYARRLEARVFDPANWNQVKQYLEGLGLDHLIQAIDDMGVDSLQDFGFLYRKKLDGSRGLQGRGRGYFGLHPG